MRRGNAVLKSSERGFVIVAVLWILVALAALATIFSVYLSNSAQALVNAVYTGDVDRGFAFAERVKCGLVQVNDAMGRPTGEDDMEEFTQRRFIGVQRAPLSYPY